MGCAMKAITVRQPWAWAIMHAGKDVENRSRNIAGSYRGPLVIHAAKSYDDDWMGAAEFIEDLTDEAIPPFDSGHGSEVLGAALGIVDLTGSHWPDAALCFDSRCLWGQWDSWHLALASPRPFIEPIPYRGALGLWEFPDELLPEVAW